MNDRKEPLSYNPIWREVFGDGIPQLRRGRHFFRLLSRGDVPRCRLCLAPFAGFGAPIAKALGRGPWRRSHRFCNKCEVLLSTQPGGCEVEMAMLFADVRGSTPMAAGMSPVEYGTLMHRFYRVATNVLMNNEAVIDKMVGDEVIGLFSVGVSGPDFVRRAAFAGREMLQVTGHGEPGGPWLSIGVAVHTGVVFAGSLVADGGAYEMVTLGDPMNFTARLVGAAHAGELVLSEDVWSKVSADIPAETRTFDLKGYDRPVTAHVALLS
jgi:adenylate cyclase